MLRPRLCLHLRDSPLYPEPNIFPVMVALLKKVIGSLCGFKLGVLAVLLNQELGSAIYVAFNDRHLASEPLIPALPPPIPK